MTLRYSCNSTSVGGKFRSHAFIEWTIYIPSYILFKRSAHSAVPNLDDWMLGCSEDWSVGRIGRIRGTGWIGRASRIGGEDREAWGDGKDWKAWEINLGG